MILTKDQILGINDIVKETVQVPEWGGEVIIRAMTAADRDAFELQLWGRDGSEDNRDNMMARLVSCCLVDEEGKRIFSNPDDVQALSGKSGIIVKRLFDVAKRLNVIGKTEVERLEKN